MKQHRFIGKFDLSKKIIHTDDRALAHQIAHVLKLRVGEEVALGDGRGNQATAIIERVSGHAVSMQIISTSPNANEPEKRVTLYASIIKHELFEFIVQKATEIGIYAIQPVIAERSIKRAVRVPRLRKIAKEAAEVSGRGIIPHVAEPLVFEDALSHASSAHEANFFFLSGAPQMHFNIQKSYNSAGIFIGPEGGWDEHEIQAAHNAHCISVGLGPLIFRAETAAVIASYLGLLPNVILAPKSYF